MKQLFCCFYILEGTQRDTLWKNLGSPFYILVVLFCSIVLIPSVFLSVLWEPFITHITGDDKSLGMHLNIFSYKAHRIKPLVKV